MLSKNEREYLRSVWTEAGEAGWDNLSMLLQRYYSPNAENGPLCQQCFSHLQQLLGRQEVKLKMAQESIQEFALAAGGMERLLQCVSLHKLIDCNTVDFVEPWDCASQSQEQLYHVEPTMPLVGKSFLQRKLGPFAKGSIWSKIFSTFPDFS